MSTSVDTIEEWMSSTEDEHIEFKEARSSFNSDKLMRYCVAIANERGGKLVLGITDSIPRQVVGTSVFGNLEGTKLDILNRVKFRVDIEEVFVDNKRVLIFLIPSRLIGDPKHLNGAYLMRSGESLVPMTAETLQSIFAESTPDFSASICVDAIFDDLDPLVVERFRELWVRTSANDALITLPSQQLLADAELIVNSRITYAALLLLGTSQALNRHLAQAEIIFEYRADEASGPASQRIEFRQGFLPVLDTLWNTINLRNDKQSFQDGLFIFTIPTFNERAVREAMLNAVAHREYRLGGSVFVKQFPKRLEIISPGGFPPGVTAQNILTRQLPRNRRIAEALAKCGLVERAGQGVNRMVEECIKESKPAPDFSDSDSYQVALALNGEVQDERFLRFLEKVGRDRLNTYTTNEFLALDLIHREQNIPPELKRSVALLSDQGIIEPVGDGKYMLSRSFYAFLRQKGIYTRRRGLDRETNKELLVKHIRDNDPEGAKFEELLQVLPALSRRQVQRLLDELRYEHRISVLGRTSAARWHIS
jgi:ATP-dependent DNA helicase RecG